MRANNLHRPLTAAYWELLHDQGISLFWPTEPVAAHTCLDLNLLYSAPQNPFQTYGGDDLIPDLIDKAACLFMHTAGGHIFDNGNKRLVPTIAFEGWLLRRKGGVNWNLAGCPAGSLPATMLLLLAPGVRVLTALLLSFAARLLGHLAGAALIVLTAGGFMRTLLSALMGMLPALHLGFMAGLIVTAFVLVVCHWELLL